MVSLRSGCCNYHNSGIIHSLVLIYRYFMRLRACILYTAIYCALSVGVYGYGLFMVVLNFCVDVVWGFIVLLCVFVLCVVKCL